MILSYNNEYNLLLKWYVYKYYICTPKWLLSSAICQISRYQISKCCVPWTFSKTTSLGPTSWLHDSVVESFSFGLCTIYKLFMLIMSGQQYVYLKAYSALRNWTYFLVFILNSISVWFASIVCSQTRLKLHLSNEWHLVPTSIEMMKQFCSDDCLKLQCGNSKKF